MVTKIKLLSIAGSWPYLVGGEVPQALAMSLLAWLLLGRDDALHLRRLGSRISTFRASPSFLTGVQAAAVAGC